MSDCNICWQRTRTTQGVSVGVLASVLMTAVLLPPTVGWTGQISPSPPSPKMRNQPKYSRVVFGSEGTKTHFPPLRLGFCFDVFPLPVLFYEDR